MSRAQLEKLEAASRLVQEPFDVTYTNHAIRFVVDGMALPVRWQSRVDGASKSGAIDLMHLNDQTIQLQFEITDAKLFGFDLHSEVE